MLGLIFRRILSLQYKSFEYIEVLPDARQINISIYPQINQKIWSNNFASEMNFNISGLFMSNKWDIDHGGAFQYHNHGWKNPSIVMNNNTFYNCSSKLRGGTIFIFESEKLCISQCSITNSNATHGGGVYLQYSKIAQILNSSLTNTVAISQQGGAGYFHNISSLVEIVNNQIVNSWANHAGGALFFLECGNITIRNVSTYFSASNINSGGSLYLKLVSNLVIEKLDISNSNANLYGGGIYSESVTMTTIFNSSFNNCSSNIQNGGVCFFISGTNLTIENSKFTNGYAFENGGAIFGQVISNVDCEKLWLENFSAKNGAGFFLHTISNRVLLKNCMFQNLYSMNSGGAFYLESIKTVILEDDTCVNCSSLINGGAIHIIVTHSIQIYHICGVSCGMTQNSSSYGSFLYLQFLSGYQKSNLVINYSSISYCLSVKSPQKGTLYMILQNFFSAGINLSQNRAEQYSAFYINHQYSGNILHSTFYNNTNTINEFVVYQMSQYSLQILFSQYIRNSVPLGFILYHQAYQGVIYNNCLFLQNFGKLFLGSNITTIKSSYLFHIFSFGEFYFFDDVHTAHENTQTLVLNHYSTLFCQPIDHIDTLLEQTPKETMRRTYDSKCEMMMMYSDGTVNDNNIIICPIFVSLLIT